MLKNWPERTLLLARDPMVCSHGFNTRFLNKKRPSLPRITCCLPRGPRELALSRLELGTTTSPGNAHPIPHPHPIADGDGWGWIGDFGPIGFHPKAHPYPSKAHPKGVWMGILGAVTMTCVVCSAGGVRYCPRQAHRVTRAAWRTRTGLDGSAPVVSRVARQATAQAPSTV